MTNHSEIYYTGDTERTMYDVFSAEAAAIISDVKAAFSWASADGAFAISTPVTHEVLANPVVTLVLSQPVTKLLVGEAYPLSARKFCMTSKKSYLKAYRLWTETSPSYLPAGCTVMFKGENRVEYNRPAPSNIDTFYDCYFKGDPATVESHFSLPERRGTHDTFYGLTVVDGAVARVKQYVYNSSTKFSDWDVVHLLYTKRAADS
jgi:hypothetical protein